MQFQLESFTEFFVKTFAASFFFNEKNLSSGILQSKTTRLRNGLLTPNARVPISISENWALSNRYRFFDNFDEQLFASRDVEGLSCIEAAFLSV